MADSTYKKEAFKSKEMGFFNHYPDLRHNLYKDLPRQKLCWVNKKTNLFF